MVDLEVLLQPVSDETPAGRDMAFSMEFDQIQEARREEDPNLGQGDWVRDVKEADWQRVMHLSQEVLISQAKDIRVAGWLLESWVKVEGFAGLEAGLVLLNGLCRRYWEVLYPQVEDGDVQTRAGNLAWIVNRVRDLSRYVPLTQAEGARFGIAYWDAANQLAQAMRRSPDQARSLAEGRITLDDFNDARSRTPPGFYRDAHRQVAQCMAALASFDGTLQAYLGDDGPSLSALSASLNDISDLLQRFAQEAGVALDAPVPAVRPASQAVDAPPPPLRTEPTLTLPHETIAMDIKEAHITSRKQALGQLRQIAAFFRETEPHSPVGYMAQKAADWGEMPLHEWLKVVVKNEEALAGLRDQLGVADGPGQ
jgi:type VI secretion system protein ImpA